MKLKIVTAPVFEPLLAPARYKAAYGGRGSGKSHFFAEHLIEDCLLEPPMDAVCLREVQKSLRFSAKKLLEEKIQVLGVGQYFEVQEKVIRTPGGGVIAFEGLQDHTAESIKSFENFRRAWLEEAQTISRRSFDLLRPTMRAPGSQIWASWNPRFKTDCIDEFFRQFDHPDAIVVRANWSDNPWFTKELEDERIRDFKNNPDGYGNIWEGEYATVAAGAYFAKLLSVARRDGRIGAVPYDPMLATYTHHDIGGAGAKADRYSIVVTQRHGQRINVIDHYTSQGQVLGVHADWLRRHYPNAEVVLPHDGINTNNVTGKTYFDHWLDAGFSARRVENQGAGAKGQRIEAIRRLFPRMWFDDQRTNVLRVSLGWYHAKIDEKTGADLGPEHDWSSHDADAFGLMAVDYVEPTTWASAKPIAPQYGTIA